MVEPGYYTFERIKAVNAATRQTEKPERFQVFLADADGSLKQVREVPPGAAITHLDLPVKLG